MIFNNMIKVFAISILLTGAYIRCGELNPDIPEETLAAPDPIPNTPVVDSAAPDVDPEDPNAVKPSATEVPNPDIALCQSADGQTGLAMADVFENSQIGIDANGNIDSTVVDNYCNGVGACCRVAKTQSDNDEEVAGPDCDLRVKVCKLMLNDCNDDAVSSSGVSPDEIDNYCQDVDGLLV